MTRSAFGPAWTAGSNMRRLRITRAVTARLMARQTCLEFTWVVLLDERDRFLSQRMALYRESVPAFVPIIWRPPDAHIRGDQIHQRIAAADYRAPWRRAVGPADDTVLMTRLDDDDGLAPDAIARYQAAAAGRSARTILMLPEGIRVYHDRYSAVRHERNAMHTLLTPPGDDLCVYDYGHTTVASVAPIVMIDDRPGWIWVRHRDTISGWRKATSPITNQVRGAFPVDWPALTRAWRS